jgi:TonB family protein
MKLHRLLVVLSLSAAANILTVRNAQAQGLESAAAPAKGVALTWLSPPNYPPLARQAGIMGDVKIQVGVRQDGSVQSAELFSGHPILAPAALDSARKSAFECRGCGEQVTSYPRTYTFGFHNGGGDCGGTERVRSPSCLYLWKCGERIHWPEYREPEVTQSLGDVTILASLACLQTETETVP